MICQTHKYVLHAIKIYGSPHCYNDKFQRVTHPQSLSIFQILNDWHDKVFFLSLNADAIQTLVKQIYPLVNS